MKARIRKVFCIIGWCSMVVVIVVSSVLFAMAENGADTWMAIRFAVAAGGASAIAIMLNREDICNSLFESEDDDNTNI